MVMWSFVETSAYWGSRLQMKQKQSERRWFNNHKTIFSNCSAFTSREPICFPLKTWKVVSTPQWCGGGTEWNESCSEKNSKKRWVKSSLKGDPCTNNFQLARDLLPIVQQLASHDHLSIWSSNMLIKRGELIKNTLWSSIFNNAFNG